MLRLISQLNRSKHYMKQLFSKTKMSRLSLAVRNSILHKRLVEKLSLSLTAKYHNCSKNAVKLIVDKHLKEGTLHDRKQKIRRSGPADHQKEAKFRATITKNKNISSRDLARKVGVSSGNIVAMKRRNGLRTYIKKRIPKQTLKQQNVSITRARKLYDELLVHKNCCILMDDETYVKMDNKAILQQQFYTKKIGEQVDDKISSIKIGKFDAKVLVWQAICSCGLRTSTFYAQGTINAAMYKKECLQKRLLPLYRKHSIPPLFWPDLATAHYARSTLDWLEQAGIRYVPKDMNPPNCPQLRPIETYWALVKRKAVGRGKTNTTIKEFKKNWAAAVLKISIAVVQTLMAGICRKVRLHIRGGKLKE